MDKTSGLYLNNVIICKQFLLTPSIMFYVAPGNLFIDLLQIVLLHFDTVILITKTVEYACFKINN